jgi:uroporphyrin-III C-methyltransferase/precorrin-2 dehydrogenase/sirohydrochlorin ferrochelatase
MYPIMLDVRGRSCVVVGGGAVALRKVYGLLEEGAAISVIAPSVVDALSDLAAAGRIRVACRPFEVGDVDGALLVFAATDDESVNRRVAAAGRAVGALVNVADDSDVSNIHLPARGVRGDLQLTVGSGGEAPFVVRRLRQRLERLFGESWGEWLTAAARFRSAVRQLDCDREQEEALFNRFFAETVDEASLEARVPSPEEERSWLGSETADHRAPLAPAVRSDEPLCEPVPVGGFVSLVGSGPGCPGLLTVRGRQRLLNADAVVYDRLALPAMPCEIGDHVELHPVGKTAGHHPMPQSEINSLLVRLAREGRRVVRLKGGDPYVFGRGGEEAEELAAEGIPFEVVPGVTSGVAASAFAGVPVTHRREAVKVTLLTAHEAVKTGGPQVRWDLLAQDPNGTIVGYMGVTALPDVVHQLLAYGMDPQTPAALIQQGTTSAQRSVVSTVAELPAAVEASGLGPPALFVIGRTVARAGHLDWWVRRPLSGHRMVVAASAVELVGLLEFAGAEVLAVPFPVTRAARAVMGVLPITACVARTVAEVEALDDERSNPGWMDSTVCWCVGEDTAAHARALGFGPVRQIPAGLECTEVVQLLGAGG